MSEQATARHEGLTNERVIELAERAHSIGEHTQDGLGWAARQMQGAFHLAHTPEVPPALEHANQATGMLHAGLNLGDAIQQVRHGNVAGGIVQGTDAAGEAIQTVGDIAKNGTTSSV